MYLNTNNQDHLLINQYIKILPNISEKNLYKYLSKNKQKDVNCIYGISHLINLMSVWLY